MAASQQCDNRWNKFSVIAHCYIIPIKVRLQLRLFFFSLDERKCDFDQ